MMDQDFPFRFGRWAWAAASCSCDAHTYTDRRDGEVTYTLYRRVLWRLWRRL